MDDFHTEGSAARSEVIDELLSNKKFKDVRDEIGKQYGIGVFKLVSTKTHADDKKLVVEGAGPISPFPDPRSWSPDDSQFGLVREEAKAFLLRNITKKGFRGARRLTAEERSFYNQHAVEVDAHGKPQRLLFGERTLDGDVFLSDAEYKALRLRMHQAGGGVRYHKKLNDEQVSLVRDASGAAVRNASGKYMLKLFPFGHQTPYGDYMEFDNLSEALAMEAKMRTDRWVFGAGVAAENITEQWGRMDATQKAAYGNNIDTYAAARVDALKRLRQNGGAMHQQEILILRQKHNMTGEQINELSARQIGESREMLAGAALHDVTDPTLRSHIGREFARGDRSAAAIYTGMTAAQKAAFATSYGIANTQNEIEKKLSELQKNFTKLHSRAGINGVRFEFQEGTVNPTWVDPHSRLLVVNLGSNVFKAAPANNFTSQAPGTQDAFGRGVTGNAAFVYATATAEEQAQVEAEWYMRGRGAADLASLSAGARNYFIRQLEVSSSTSGLDYRDPEHRRFIETAWHSRTQVDFDSPNAQAAMTYALLHEMGHNLVQRDIEAGIGSGRKGWKKLTRKYTTGETGAAATEMAATEIAKQLAADAGLSAKFDAGRKIVLGRAAEQSLQRAGRRKEAYDEALKRRGGVRNIRDEHITAVLGSTDKALEETLGFVAGARGELELEASIAPDIHKEVALRMRMEVEAGNTNYGMGTGSAASNIWGSLSDSEKNALKGRVAAARGIDLSVVSDSDVLTSLSSAYSSINPITGSLNSQVDTLESDSGVLRRTGKKMSQREADNLEQMRGSLPALVQSQVDDVLDAKGAASRAYRKRRAKWQSQTAVEVAADAVEIHNEVVT
jgi:hypothetical protein